MFAGPFDRGEYSPSVQKTLYDTQILVLDRIPEASQTDQIDMMISLEVWVEKTLDLMHFFCQFYLVS